MIANVEIIKLNTGKEIEYGSTLHFFVNYD